MRKITLTVLCSVFIFLNVSSQNELSFFGEQEIEARKQNSIDQSIRFKRKLLEKLASKGDNSFVSELDSLALVALYNSTNGSSWTDNNNWLTGPVYTWTRVEVFGGFVSSIKLFSNNLKGSLPSEIGNLANL